MSQKTDKTAPAPPPADQASAPTADTQQVEILRSHPRYGYWPGQQAALTAEHIAVLVEGGYAKLVETPETPAE